MTKPIISISVVLAVCVCSLFAEPNVLPGYNGRFLGGYTLSPRELCDIPVEDLGYMRNEIFAKYGRPFKTAKYSEYFSKKGWYRINPEYSDNFLTEQDKNNVNLILSFERPAMKMADMRRALLKNIEYSNDVYTVVFSDAGHLLLHNEIDYYSEDADEVYTWEIKGNWIVAERKDGGKAGERVLLLLDHKNAIIIRMEYLYK